MTVLSYRFTLRTAIYAAAWLIGLMALADIVAAGEDATNGAAADKSDSADKAAKGAAGEFNDGRLIRIRLPLVGNSDAHIKTSIQRAIEQLGKMPRHQGRRPILVLELVPARRHAGYGEGTDFERAVSVARYLTSQELSAVKTVAYIPQSIKGHGVLIALACEEIVMDPDAEIGEAGVDEKEHREIEPGILSMYEQIAAARRTVPEAIAVAMLDRRVELVKAETDQSTEFILRDDMEKLKKDHTIVSDSTLVPRGTLANFTGREGRELGFVKLLASNTEALARGLGLPPQAVVEDQSLVGDWRPVIIELAGPITPRKVHQLQTLIGNEISERNVNWIGLRIDSTGGEISDCLRLADTLATLDRNEVRTVAYVPAEASGGAALVALACDQLVMQPDAKVGGTGAQEPDRGMLDSVRTSLGELAKETDQSWSLLAALIDPSLTVYSYQNTKTGEVRYYSGDEASKLSDAKDWRRGAQITTPRQPLRLSAKQASDLGLVSQVVDNYDDFKQLYGFESDPRVAEPNWALELIEAMSSPALTVLLLVLGFVGIYVELHAPGTGVGGFVSALAFLLFFWSKFLHGTAGWLEVLLFLGGICCVFVEVLVLPGMAIFGLGGGIMILASLVFASQTFILPQTASQLAELRGSLSVVAAATACMVVVALALRRYLPKSPMLRPLLLNPLEEHEREDIEYREAMADFSHLVGRHGTAATHLMPAGKAEFDGQLVDVIAEGMPVERGQVVVVVRAKANRVVVRGIEG
jgi:membrane-bound ClpP family serine protease